MDANIDPYKILKVPKNFTIDQLKDAYKKMALQVHPDKGGSEYLFKLVTLCYHFLMREYKKKNHTEKEFHELKTNFKKETDADYNSYRQNMNENIDKNGFNIHKFNEIFSKNKLESITDIGYQDFLNDGKEIEQKNLFENKKFSSSQFNKIFEKKTQNIESNSKVLTKYKEPKPLEASNKIAFTELGVDLIDDFSNDNISRKNLNYMDLKIAHTTSRIVDPKTVEKRKNYNNIKEFQQDRASISYIQDDNERKYYEKQKYLEELNEKKRIQNLLNHDNKIKKHYEKINKLFLGK